MLNLTAGNNTLDANTVADGRYRKPREDTSDPTIGTSLDLSPLKLNFQYDSQCRECFDFSILSSSSSSSASTFSLVDPRSSFNLHYYMQHIRDRQADFRKFLPSPLSSLDMPHIALNEKDEKEYDEAQEALYNSAPRSSQSETGVSTRLKRAEGRREKGCLFLDILNCTKEVPDSPEFQDISTTHTRHRHRSQPKNLPRPANIRFDLDVNEPHCLLSAFSKNDNKEFSISLYVELPKEPNHYLCHVQTELSVAGLKAYFGSLEETASIELLWVRNLQGKISELLTSKQHVAKFNDVVFLKRFECVLVLSPKASALVRHPKLVFLHSISTALMTNPRKMLVLVKNGQWDATIPEVRPPKPFSFYFW